MDSFKVNTICKLDSKLKVLKKSDNNFYSILKPTIFFLRFFGAPTGLWRQCNNSTRSGRIITKIAAIVMLVGLNGGAVMDSYSTIKTMSRPDRDFDDNMYLFYALSLNVTGALALDILWWRRRILRQLLDQNIDFEPKLCDHFDNENKKENSREIRRKTVRMLGSMMIFTGFTIWSVIDSTSKSKMAWTDYEFHEENIILVIRVISVIVFALVLSFYISLSWIFRLKVQRINCFLKRVLLFEAKSGNVFDDVYAKVIEEWFTSFVIQFKKFEFIFKQIAGLLFLVQVWSVLSMAKECITAIIQNKWVHHVDRDLGHELFSCLLLGYFLFSLSIVEHYLIKLVKLLYQLSLTIRFISGDIRCIALSKKFKLMADTIDKTGLNLSVFGLLRINRHLIVSTASCLTTYTILMYELSSDKHLLIH